MRVPVTYELEPTGVNGALEGNGIVHFYCSTICRSISDYSGDIGDDIVPGWDDDGFLDETLCETCNSPIATRG